jgi:hypothetical protein
MADGPVLAGNARDSLMRDAKKGVDLVFFFSCYGGFFCLVLLLTGGGKFVFVQEVWFFARFAIGRIYLETFYYYWEVIPLVQGVVRATREAPLSHVSSLLTGECYGTMLLYIAIEVHRRRLHNFVFEHYFSTLRFLE